MDHDPATAGTIFQDTHLLCVFGFERSGGSPIRRPASAQRMEMGRPQTASIRIASSWLARSRGQTFGHRKGAPRRKHGGKAVVLVAVERSFVPGEFVSTRYPWPRGSAWFSSSNKRWLLARLSALMECRPISECSSPGYIHEPRPDRTFFRTFTVSRRCSNAGCWYQGRVSREQLDHYLDEFAFRFNRRLPPPGETLFYRLVQQAVSIEPTPYASLVKGPKLRRT